MKCISKTNDVALFFVFINEQFMNRNEQFPWANCSFLAPYQGFYVFDAYWWFGTKVAIVFFVLHVFAECCCRFFRFNGF